MTALTTPTEYVASGLYINGLFEAPTGCSDVAIEDPATEMALGLVPQAGPEQVDAALRASARAFKEWSRTAAGARAGVLRHAASILRRDAPSRARIVTLEQGKPLAEATSEIRTSADLFDCFADLISRPLTEPGVVTPAGYQAWVTREPVGPVVVITPWNFPVSLAARKIGAAIAAGCTAIVKPATETPASFDCVVHALDEAGLPPGVLGVLNGNSGPLCERLISAAETRAISFTGSTRVGRIIARTAAEVVKPVTLELGGHAPVIVTADADLETAAAELAATKFRNAGQVCVTPTRFFVETKAYPEFTELLRGHAAALVVGNGIDAGTQMGPLANAGRRSAIEELIEDATRRGARVVHGASRQGSSGYFFQPTVLAEVPLDAVGMIEEPFGPLALLRPVQNVHEAVEVANNSRYGLAGYVYTGSEEQARFVSQELHVGMVGVNTCQITRPDTPVGGVKDSGYGRDGGTEGLREMFVTKAVTASPLAGA